MSQENEPQRPSAGHETSYIIRGVSELVSMGLDVGAALAKATAKATAGEREVPEPDSRQGSFDLLVHYGITTMTNVVGAVVAGVNEATTRATAGRPPAESADSGSPASPLASIPRALPSVRLGSTLRLPLSIENPGPETMDEMAFRCLAMSGGQPETGQLLTVDTVRFIPETLSVASRDFEKLTVFIDVPETAAQGRYTATIGLVGGQFESALQFDVLPPEV